MKIRRCFVSNSSSSSFVIRNEDITEDQWAVIMNHSLTEGDIRWHIKQDLGFMVGQTTSHSYDMESYFKKIGIANDKILWMNT